MEEHQHLSLYMFRGCPYCHRVIDAMNRLNLQIELRDTYQNPAFGRELKANGGMSQVPCLRIEKPDGTVQWLYESVDIIKYLESVASSS